jgi:hypothetical protein
MPEVRTGYRLLVAWLPRRGGGGWGEGYYDNFGQIDHYNLLRLGRTYEAIKTGYKIGT